MLTLEPVTPQNFRAVVRMELKPGQEQMVTSNAVSLAQCAIFPEPRHPRAICWNGEPVGFVMATEEDGRIWIDRLLIDRRHQGKGYGRAGLAAYVAWLIETLNPEAIHISALPDNADALGLYRAMGFAETGEVVEDDIVLALPRERFGTGDAEPPPGR